MIYDYVIVRSIGVFFFLPFMNNIISMPHLEAFTTDKSTYKKRNKYNLPLFSSIFLFNFQLI